MTQETAFDILLVGMVLLNGVALCNLAAAIVRLERIVDDCIQDLDDVLLRLDEHLRTERPTYNKKL